MLALPFALALAGSAQTVAPLVEPPPSVSVPLAPAVSPALGGLESLDASLASSLLEPLPALEPLGRSFDGMRGLPSAPESPSSRRPIPSIPAARDVPYKGQSYPSYAFSQHAKIGDLLVRAIRHTDRTLDIAIHGLSIPGVAQALVEAHQRGVALRVICNEEHLFPGHGHSHSRSPELQSLIDEGVDIRVLRGTGKYGVMHSKYAVFDGELVEFGSFNWSEQANDDHYENAKFDDSKPRIEGFQGNFEWMWGIAQPLDGRRGAPQIPSAPPADSGPGVEYKGEHFPAYMFSPRGGVEARLVRAVELTEAGETIDVVMFAFFSQALADALVEAHHRGAIVRVVSDKGQGRRSPQIRWLLENGVDVRWSSGHNGSRGVMHNKFGIFNGELLETGSFNWSDNAELHNFENANFIDDEQDIAGYEADFDEIWAQASSAGVQDLDPAAYLPNPPLE